MAAGGRAAEAQHRAEAGEEQHLIKLMAQIGARWTGKDLVADHLAVLIDSDVEQETMWQGELNVVLLWRPGLRIVRERNELGGAQDIERDIIGDGVHGDARRDQLQHKNENKYSG